jgi:hypothetical protein
LLSRERTEDSEHNTNSKAKKASRIQRLRADPGSPYEVCSLKPSS